MSSYRHKQGRIARSTGFSKDGRRLLIACEDENASPQYFDFLRLPRVEVRVVPSEGGRSAAKHILDNLVKHDDGDFDERWLVLDVDRYDRGNQKSAFVATLQAARASGIRVALSKPCFEVWLLLHHVDETDLQRLMDCKDVVMALKPT